MVGFYAPGASSRIKLQTERDGLPQHVGNEIKPRACGYGLAATTAMATGSTAVEGDGRIRAPFGCAGKRSTLARERLLRVRPSGSIGHCLRRRIAGLVASAQKPPDPRRLSDAVREGRLRDKRPVLYQMKAASSPPAPARLRPEANRSAVHAALNALAQPLFRHRGRRPADHAGQTRIGARRLRSSFRTRGRSRTPRNSTDRRLLPTSPRNYGADFVVFPEHFTLRFCPAEGRRAAPATGHSDRATRAHRRIRRTAFGKIGARPCDRTSSAAATPPG